MSGRSTSILGAYPCPLFARLFIADETAVSGYKFLFRVDSTVCRQSHGNLRERAFQLTNGYEAVPGQYCAHPLWGQAAAQQTADKRGYGVSVPSELHRAHQAVAK